MKKILYGIYVMMMTIGSIVSFADAQNYQDMGSFVSNISSQLKNTQPEHLKDIIYGFCQNMIKNTQLAISGDNYYYKASDSVFLHSLCNQINPGLSKQWNPMYVDAKDGYLLRRSFEDFGIVNYDYDGYDYCDSNKSLQYCDMISHIDQIFDMIINDMINIKQSQLYGLQNPDFGTVNIDTQINDFGKDKFGPSMLICDSKKNKYNQVCKIMNSYIKKSAKLLKGLSIINYDNIYKTKPDTKKLGDECNLQNIRGNSYQNVQCGLFAGGLGVSSQFINMIYNELFFYRMFVVYYQNITSLDYNLAPQTEKTEIQKINYLKNESINLNNNINKSQKNISVTIDSLNNIYSTFATHIGLLMYQEDLLSIRNDYLSKLVTPFYTLSNKLINVQEQ